MKKGFTLVELVIVIAIVIVLSVVSVPIYRSYVDKAKMSEGYALVATILSAQKAYYSEHGYFLRQGESAGLTDYEPTLGVDARGNKYFKLFWANGSNGNGRPYYFNSQVFKPAELSRKADDSIILQYNLTLGSNIYEGGWSEADGFDSSLL